jgi:uncharacterized membrane protein YdjX (TVP38/TMEM64 family)
MKLKTLILLVAVPVLLALVALSPTREWLGVGVAWTQSHHRIAGAAFVAGYVVAAVLVVPGSILTLAAGFVFGLPLGVVLVSIGSVAGAGCAFLVARHLARDWIAARIEKSPRFKAFDSATRHEGFLIVFLARLSPLFPFNLMNYGLGLTGVRFRDFLVASWIGMLPATILYVYVGTLAKNVSQLVDGVEDGLAGRTLLAGGFLATAVLTVVITRKANRALADHLTREAAEIEGR